MKFMSTERKTLARKIVTGLVISGALISLSGCSLLGIQSEEPNTTPTEPQIPEIVPADPQSGEFSMRKGDVINFTLPAGDDWIAEETGIGYFNADKTCLIGFESKDDASAGTPEEVEATGGTEEEVKDLYFQETGVKKFGATYEQIIETQQNFNVEVDGHFVEFRTAPVTREDGTYGHYGLASWPYEGTYIAVLMNCKPEVSSDQAATTWELAMKQAVGTKN